VYFWRTATGSEFGILVEQEGKLIPIEVKLSAIPKPSMADGIHSLREDLGETVAPRYLVQPGTIHLPTGGKLTALPFGEL
jgi:predicted AAA+ superfamily ATPase